eukprot:763899-Hanusia_phi.AAC.2
MTSLRKADAHRGKESASFRAVLRVRARGRRRRWSRAGRSRTSKRWTGTIEEAHASLLLTTLPGLVSPAAFSSTQLLMPFRDLSQRPLLARHTRLQVAPPPPETGRSKKQGARSNRAERYGREMREGKGRSGQMGIEQKEKNLFPRDERDVACVGPLDMDENGRS